MEKNEHRAGFVSILGRPNVGKSTLLNSLMGYKLNIVSPKAQTTRHRIFGIYNDDDAQIVFSDTPGIIDPKYKLQEKMMENVRESLSDSDAFIYMVDAKDEVELPDNIQQKLPNVKAPILLIVNKIDEIEPDKLASITEQWHNVLPKAEILPISALHGFNTDFIIPKIKSWLPINPPYYAKDAITDKSERFFVNENIREKILLNYEKEIPYSVEVVTESFKEEDNFIHIESTIYTERESQKGILLGHKGERLKKVRYESQRDLEEFFNKKVTLHLFIKVNKDWRKSNSEIKKFGY